MALESCSELARRIVRDLADAGHLAYWVGGCVRDQLLGLTPKDYDVATSAPPEVALQLFPGSTLVGESFGVVLVPGGVEVATFRSEMNYHDGRRPSHVQYETDPSLDAARRDFTINALYYDPLKDEVIDFTGGRNDIANRLVRAIGDPHERFAEDHLRLLRSVRFAARFDYRIEAVTLDALIAMAPQIRRIAPERLHDEMRRILTGPNLELAWHYLDISGLWKQLVPESNHGERLARLTGPVSVALGWAALIEGVTRPQDIYRRFRFSRQEAEGCQDLLENEQCFTRLEEMSVVSMKRFVRKSNFEEHLELHRASYGESVAFSALAAMRQQWSKDELWPPPLLNGEDLIGLGLEPGPAFRQILNALEDAQLEGRVQTREEAVRLALSQRRGDVHPES